MSNQNKVFFCFCFCIYLKNRFTVLPGIIRQYLFLSSYTFILISCLQLDPFCCCKNQYLSPGMTLFGWMHCLDWFETLNIGVWVLLLCCLARVEVAFSMSIWFKMTDKIFCFDLHKIFSLVPADELKRFFGHRSFRPGYLAPISRTRNIIFEARLFCFMAWRTRNITFEAHLFVCLFFLVIERGILHLKRAKWLENKKLSNPGEMTWGEMTGYHWSYSFRVNLTRLEPVKEEDLSYLGWT